MSSRLRLIRDMLVVNGSSLFDERWYVDQHPELRLRRVDACRHFLTEGWRLGADPGPNFDTSWYLQQYPNVWATGTNPLLHYLRGGREDGCEPCPGGRDVGPAEPVPSRPQGLGLLIRQLPRMLGALRISQPYPTASRAPADEVCFQPGALERAPTRPTVLLCAHASGRRLFGAERSLLDLLDAFRELDLNVIATLPVPNADYQHDVAARCLGTYVFAYPQWAADVPELPEVVDRFARIITDHSVDVVHANTIMLREVLTAARRVGITSVVHVREVIESDAGLTEQIGLPAAAIVDKVLQSADFLVANSQATADCYGGSSQALVVGNPVDVSTLNISNDVTPGDVRVGLVSSNDPKKGIADFVEIAVSLLAEPGFRFVAVGPETPFVASLLRERDRIPKNLEFVGYVDSPLVAVRKLDVVVSLSHVAESFGRSVAEAMAARRPVVAYDHGAVSELVVDGETGFLVPVGDRKAVAQRLVELCADSDRIRRMGERGRRHVQDQCSREAFVEALASVYDSVLTAADAR